LLDENDFYHAFIDKKMRELAPPFYTCEAVISESMFLLQHAPKGTERVIELLDSGKIITDFSYKQVAGNIHKLIKNYMNVPMSFADACLVCMVEHTRNGHIFTIDSDFKIYRDQKGESLSLIIPDTA